MISSHLSNLIVAVKHDLLLGVQGCTESLYPNYQFDFWSKVYNAESTCFHDVKWDEIIVFVEGAYYNKFPNNLSYNWGDYRETESAEEYKIDFCGGHCTDVFIVTNEDATYNSSTDEYDFSNTTELGRVIFGAVDSSKIQPKVGEEASSNDSNGGASTTYKIGFYFRDEEGLYHDLSNYFTPGY